LEKIGDVAVRGADIVRQLMIYAGQESDDPDSIDVSRTIAEMCGLLKSAISKRVVLVTDLSHDLPAVKARASQLCQIVMNLVVNASDAMKDSTGEVRVTTSLVTLDPHNGGTSLEELPGGDYLQLEVSDTGTGMPPELQARIFDPFFSTKSAGRGLGLPVVHGIVRGLRGAIRVKSHEGRGTTFQILLPSVGHVARERPATAVSEPESGPAEHPTVLVVEDEAPLRSAVTKLLGREGYKVLQAADGAEAVALLQANTTRIDLLFLDMTIPGCPSHEVLKKALQRSPETKVILTSAYSEEMARMSLAAPQVRGFIRKPFRLLTLISTFRNALMS
jgi:CheY-like chemotaxis protein